MARSPYCTHMHVVSSHPRAVQRVQYGMTVLVVLAAYFTPLAYAQTSSDEVRYAQNASVAAGPVTPAARPAMQEVHVANNGLMLVRGAHVVAVSGTMMSIVLEWGSAHLTWTVRATSDTKYFGPTGIRGSADDVQAGDIVSVTGMLSASDPNPSIVAEFVRRQ